MANFLENIFGGGDDDDWVQPPLLPQTPGALGYSPTVEGKNYIPIGYTAGSPAQEMLQNLMANMALPEMRQRWTGLTPTGGGAAGSTGAAGYSTLLQSPGASGEDYSYQEMLRKMLQQLGVWPGNAEAGKQATAMPYSGYDPFVARQPGTTAVPMEQKGMLKRLRQERPSFAVPSMPTGWADYLVGQQRGQKAQGKKKGVLENLLPEEPGFTLT